MSAPTPIPPEYRTLIGLLRCAVNRRPPEDGLLVAADWPAVLRQARQHGVDTYLYPWLAEHAPALFSARADVPPDSAPAAWRALFLEAVPRTLLRQRQLAEILAAFARARIDVIPLKGSWLSETVYDDPAQRSMSDLDVLVRECDLDACHALLLSLGYRCERDVRHNDYFKDQTYIHPVYPFPVEAHWRLSAPLASPVPATDIAALWQRSAPSTLLACPVRALSVEDQVLHLTQHILLHDFAMPLRGYLDIALLVRHAGCQADGTALSAVAASGGLGRCVGFVLAFVADLFAAPPPSALAACVRPADPEKHAAVLTILAHLPAADEHRGESMLVHLEQATLAGRVRFLLSRLFLPRAVLAVMYPCARHARGVPVAWLCRLRDLLARYRKRIDHRLRPGAPDGQALGEARARESLIDWLLENKKPG